MTTNAMEKALWQIGTSDAEAERFRSDPLTYAAAFRLDGEEVRALGDLDVREMARRGASTLLLMMAFLAVKGPASMPDYMQNMNRPGAG